jgi:hypothetical protein
VNVLEPAVKPVRTNVRVETTPLTVPLYAESAVEAAIVEAPETATPIHTFPPVVPYRRDETLMSAVVPVVSVTAGFVPGEPDKLAVKDADVVEPVAFVCAPTGVTHTQTEPL